MNIEQRKLENATMELMIEVPSERIAAEYVKVYNEIQKSAKVDGFRAGKAPLHLVKNKYKESAEKQVVENVIKDHYYAALKEKGLYPIAYPEFDFDKLVDGTNFKFKAIFEVAPTVELGDYKDIAADERQVKISDEDVNYEIDAIREKMATLSKKEDGSSVENGDFVRIGTKKVDGLPAEEIEAATFSTNAVIAGKSGEEHNFDSHISGMKVGEEKKISFKYPKDYQIAEFAGQKAEHVVKVMEISKRALPALDDEFAKDAGNYTSLDDMKSKIKEDLTKYASERSRAEAKAKILEKIIEGAKFDVPKSMIDREKESILERLTQRIGFQISSFEQFAAMFGMKPDDFSAKLETEALQSIKSTLVLAEISKKEDLKVTDEKFNEAVSSMAEKNGKSVEELKELIEKNDARRNIESELLFDAAMDFIYEKGKIKNLSPVSFKEFLKG